MTDRGPLSPATLERVEYETVVEVMARWGDADALAEVGQWLRGTLRDGSAPSESITATAYEILLERAGLTLRSKHYGQDFADARPLIAEGFQHRHYTVRERAIDAALLLGDASVHGDIADRLVDRSDVVQRAARNALLTLDPSAAATKILAIIGNQEATGQEAPAPVTLTWSAAMITSDLDAASRDEQTRKLDYRARARIYALETLLRPNRIEGLGPVLLAVIDDSARLSDAQLSTIPVLACSAMQFVHQPHAIAKALITRLEQPAEGTATWALRALGALRVKDALDTFQHYLASGDAYQRRAAIVGLGRLEGPQAREPVEKLWRDICSKSQKTQG